jgi:hypothetical protein
MTVDRNTIETKPIIALREFFSAKSNRPVSMQEFSDFWKACSDAEKTEMREVIKKWDGESAYIPVVQ